MNEKCELLATEEDIEKTWIIKKIEDSKHLSTSKKQKTLNKTNSLIWSVAMKKEKTLLKIGV